MKAAAVQGWVQKRDREFICDMTKLFSNYLVPQFRQLFTKTIII